ncbi:MFS transporter [Paeniglutamicibacter sp. ZC-3]|uniref:MFS transporter n=1 Tax=Paeniglutamicibacter sp. ZC-3 TaxID=2986919 RepID=UPI0021F7A275|nr:MFS transporter [Paeniglutamicibacter sp. ZC-3]MCV9994566.1 MFS transporter [Paeniglutamicibacter sp. ZC-3]
MSQPHDPPTKLFTRDFLLAAVANLFISMVFYLLMTSMALYAVDRFQASDSAAGLASSAFVIGSVVARLFAGKMLQVMGRKRLAVLALGLFALSSVFYLLSSTLLLLLIVRLVHGMAFGMANTAIATAVQSLIPQARRSEGTGYFGLSTTLSTAVGPFLAVLLAGSGNYTSVFVFCTIFSASALLFTLLVRMPEPQRPTHLSTAHARRGSFIRSIISPAALPISLVILVCGIAYSGIISFLAPFLISKSMTEAASWFFMLYAVTVLLSRLFAGRIQDRRGDNAIMYPLLVVFALGMAALAFDPSSLTVASAAALTGFGFGALMPCAQAIAVSSVPPAELGVATSTFFLMLDVGIGFGPVALGLLIPHLGYTGMFGSLAVLAVLGIVLYFQVHGRHARGNRPGAI